MFIRLFALVAFCFFQICTAAELVLPTVDAEIDPARSFWNDHVHYPFPHQYALVKDKQGRTWEIAYADLFRGETGQRAKAPVLVLLHGRGMNSGYWGQLMERPLAAGWRVVAIDWSNSGKSLPKNLDRPVTRSLEDSRYIVHDLVVRHLGIAKASYLGHSLGGQLAAGYALQFPENVERLVLYAPGGLESMAAIEQNGFRYDDPTLEKRPEVFLKAWREGKLLSMGESQEAVEKSFYVTPRPGAIAYLQRGDKLNDFMVASRASILKGNPRERERFQQNYAWETIASVSECRIEDKESLPNRIPKLKVPTLLALGALDPIILPDNAEHVFGFARRNQSPIQIKIYEKGGHFIHTDLPELFSREVLDFLTTGKAAEPLYQGVKAPERTPLANLPPEVLRFKQRAEAAYAKQDIEAIKRAIYHPDYRRDGQSLKEHLDTFAAYVPMISQWQMLIYSVEREGDLFVLDVEVKTSLGNVKNKVWLKESNGEWFSYGNQK